MPSMAPAQAPEPADPVAAAITQATATGEAVAVTSQTSEASTLIANPDGTLTRTDSSSPQRVLRGGKWAPIDTTLVRGSDGRYSPKAAVTSVSFAGGEGGKLVSLKDGANALGFSWPTKLQAPSVSGDTATYPDVLPDVDLQLTADASGYSSILVIKTARAAANPAVQRLTLGVTATHLTVTGTADGGAEATDTTTGATVFHSDTALMWDSTPTAGEPAVAATAVNSPQGERTASARLGGHRAQVKVDLGPGNQTLTLDKSLLTAKTTKYPVFVDPEWSGSPGKSQLNWARISSNGWNVYNSTSKTGATNARAGYDDWDGGDSEKARTYYQMNTAGIKGAVVSKAHLYVTEFWAASCADTNAAVYGTSATSGWSSSTLYWNHEPTRTAILDSAASHEADCGTSSPHVTPARLDFDVTGRVKTAATGNWASAYFVVEAQNMSDKYSWKQLGYGGGATLSVTYSYRPKLKDGTGDPAIHPSVIDQGKTLTTTHTPTLSARGVNPDLAGGSETVRVEYQVFNSSGAQVGVGYGPASGYNANGSDWTTPSLADGTYTWKATVENSSLLWAGVWTPTQTFTVDTTAPHAPTVGSTQFPPNQIGGAFGDKGTFALGNDYTNNVTGYLFSLDGDLSNTTYAANHGTAWTTTTVAKPATIYYAKADNATGTGTVAVNGSAGISLAPGTVGAHKLYVKAVDQAGSTSPQTPYQFYAGTSIPIFAYGDKLVTGWTSTHPDGTTVNVPAATSTSAGGHLVTQPNYPGYYLADGYQGMLANNAGTKVANGDSATFSFDIPQAGPWDIGVNVTTGIDYGTYRLTLDASTTHQGTLIDNFDAYSAHTNTHYLDFGIPKDSHGTLQSLDAGLHTLTLTLTGINPASTGYQAGLDVLRLAPTATCAINNTTTCLNNTAISTYTAGTTPTITKASADGFGWSLNAGDLTAAGWTAGRTVTINGAAIKLPSAMGDGTSDNMLGSGQVVTVPTSGVVNRGNAVVFAGFATDGATKNATGTIQYADDGSCPQSEQPYTMDTVLDWATGAPPGTILTLAHRNFSNATQATNVTPSIFAISVPLVCPTTPVASISLPLVSNGVQLSQSAVHFLGLGIRPTSITESVHWVGSWAAAQNTGHVQSQPTAGTAVDATLNNQTIRIPVHLSIGTDPGSQVRIHLSNAVGTAPVTVDAASVAIQDSTAGGATPAGTPVPITFGGSAAATLPAGTDLSSDPVSLAAPQLATLLISLKAHGSLAALSGHLDAMNPVYVTASDNVDHTGDTAATSYSKSTMTGIPFLSGVDVSTPADLPTGALVLYGDQTVNADTASGDGQSSLSDDIAAAVATDPNGDGTVPYGILNEGVSSWGNRSLLPTVTNAVTPRNSSGSLDRYILSQTNVRTVLISSGASDLLTCTSTDANTCAVAIEDKLTRIASQLRAYYTDDSTNFNVSMANESGSLTVYVATIPPFTGTHTATQETAREAVNAFILDGANQLYLKGAADGAMDFAAAVSTGGTDTSDAVKPADLYVSGTNTYPNDIYYRDLAQRYLVDSAPSEGNVSIQPNFVGAMVVTQ
jgi:hypothetical protein